MDTWIFHIFNAFNHTHTHTHVYKINSFGETICNTSKLFNEAAEPQY